MKTIIKVITAFTVFIWIISTNINSVLAFTENDLRSCHENMLPLEKNYCDIIKKSFGCKQELNQLVSDTKYILNEVKNDKEFTNNEFLYRLIESYNYFNVKKNEISKSFDENINQIDIMINRLNTAKEQSNDANKSYFDQAFQIYFNIKSDLQNVKIFCENEADNSKNEILDIVPFEMKESFKKLAYATENIIGSGKEITNLPIKENWVNVVKKLKDTNIKSSELDKLLSTVDGNSTQVIKKQGLIKRIFNKFIVFIKKIF